MLAIRALGYAEWYSRHVTAPRGEVCYPGR